MTNHPEMLYNDSGGGQVATHLENNIASPLKLTLTVNEMAQQLNISRTTAYNLVKQRDFFPAFRVGNRVLVGTTALSLWVDKQTEGKAI